MYRQSIIFSVLIVDVFYIDNFLKNYRQSRENSTIIDIMKVLNVGRISLEKYEKVSANILTRDVIITEERIRHIQERHPNDYERFKDYLTEIVEEPDYIIRANKPNTALILKEITFNNEQFKLILRLITESDDPKYKNSIITFMKIDEKEWNRLVRNKETLYKKD